MAADAPAPSHIWVVLTTWPRPDGTSVVGVAGVYTSGDAAAASCASDPGSMLVRVPVDSSIKPEPCFVSENSEVRRSAPIARCAGSA
jgi:hypothetical protein